MYVYGLPNKGAIWCVNEYITSLAPQTGSPEGLILRWPPKGFRGYSIKVPMKIYSNSMIIFSEVLVAVHSKLNRGIELKMKNYDIPKGMAPNSYVTFENILTELQLAHQNKNLLEHLNSELTKNSNEDWWVRVGFLVTTAIASGALILSRIKKLRDILRWNTNRRDPLGASGASLPMFQSHLTWNPKFLISVETEQTENKWIKWNNENFLLFSPL